MIVIVPICTCRRPEPSPEQVAREIVAKVWAEHAAELEPLLARVVLRDDVADEGVADA